LEPDTGNAGAGSNVFRNEFLTFCPVILAFCFQFSVSGWSVISSRWKSQAWGCLKSM